jgi:hypothetical protein
VERAQLSPGSEVGWEYVGQGVGVAVVVDEPPPLGPLGRLRLVAQNLSQRLGVVHRSQLVAMLRADPDGGRSEQEVDAVDAGRLLANEKCHVEPFVGRNQTTPDTSAQVRRRAFELLLGGDSDSPCSRTVGLN